MYYRSSVSSNGENTSFVTKKRRFESDTEHHNQKVIAVNLTNVAVLQINASFEPTSFISGKDAARLVAKGAAVIEEARDREIRPGFPLPSVIRLTRYANIPHRIQILSRKNLYIRDRYTCQYCGQKPGVQSLDLDHVQPKSRGGRDTWDNLVTSCKTCNRRKADRTPEEANMPLLSRPRPVTIHTARHLLRSLGESEPVWRKYLYFDNLTPQEN